MTEVDARAAGSGLEALLTLLHLQGVAADREQLKHRIGTAAFGASDIVRASAQSYSTSLLRDALASLFRQRH